MVRGAAHVMASDGDKRQHASSSSYQIVPRFGGLHFAGQ